MYSATIGCRAQMADLQSSDTVIVFEDRRVLIPLGSDTSCVSLYTVSRDGSTEYLHRCPMDPTRERQVAIKNASFNSVLRGEELGTAYFDGFKVGQAWSGDKIIEKGVSDHGKYIIISRNDGVRYRLNWFTPNSNHLIEIHYVLDEANFHELGGMTELRRFAERVRLFPE